MCYDTGDKSREAHMTRPDFDIAFSIGSFHVYWYALLVVAGIAAAMLLTDRRVQKRPLPKEISLDLCILGVPFGVLGARLFACLFGSVSWSRFFDLSYPGLSLFGGLSFAAGAILLYLALRKADISELLDAAAPGVFLGLGIRAWGDFFNRSHYGPLVETTAHKWFPLATFGSDLQIHYAAFFYEFLLCLLLVLLYYTWVRRRVKGKGDRFLLLAMLFCLGRYLIDCIRVDGIPAGPLSFDQWCEVGLFALCFLLIMRNKKLLRPGAAALLLILGLFTGCVRQDAWLSYRIPETPQPTTTAIHTPAPTREPVTLTFEPVLGEDFLTDRKGIPILDKDTHYFTYYLSFYNMRVYEEEGYTYLDGLCLNAFDGTLTGEARICFYDADGKLVGFGALHTAEGGLTLAVGENRIYAEILSEVDVQALSAVIEQVAPFNPA